MSVQGSYHIFGTDVSGERLLERNGASRYTDVEETR